MSKLNSFHHWVRFKHVAFIEKEEKGIICAVKPVLVNETHPFYHIERLQNAVSIDGDIVGNICIQGPGAGMLPDGHAIIEDLVYINKPSLSPISQIGTKWIIC